MTKREFDPLDAEEALGGLTTRTRELTSTANGFARAMTGAFASSVTGGKQFDDVLKSLALRLSGMAVKLAFKPVESFLSTGLQGLLSSLLSGTTGVQQQAQGGIKPFAAGGVIGTPSYFPMLNGGVGLAGEAGPEAILPLARGPDGRLGVASQSGGATTIHVQIATPDPESFRRSESYITGQIARAVSRGQRGM
uniref:Gene transfer agent (GTA) like protein n=1 Tax=Rhodopseudomonas palustris (strain BisA53) TaxID=316055 RepID=Q07QC0_RHOP5